MNILKGLNPESVFRYFEEISAVPRGSGHTEKITEYCEEFAKEHGLKYISDDTGNIVIFKGGSKGRENEKTVIIQGHTDIVWEKDGRSNINFETDGLKLAVDGDFVFAEGTTLGGDDGIAVAMCLALLASDEYSHPPLEIVFTTGEEIGMIGAMALDTSVLSGKRMLNLDSEAEGTLWVSCAGGARANISLDVNYESSCGQAYKITVSGLHGGHSGAEIHNGYVNANKIMGKLLKAINADFNVADIFGGSADNAITRDCTCIITSDNDDMVTLINSIGAEFCSRIKSTDPDAFISACVFENSEKCLSSESTERLIALLNELPSGVISMSKEIEGLVETSLNLGILRHSEGVVEFSFSVRSSKDGEKAKLCERLKAIAQKHSCKISFNSEYPAWEYKEDSEIRDVMSKVYSDMFGKEMTVTAIHAGLECGLFCGKIKELDCVSFGPDMFDIHTPSEKLSISSTERTWNYLLKVLERI